ncbi:MAG: hypothetical protein HC888_13970 [Candidatus Competibacteraceae bacterium]|nr:hypothetical protein [Candidatus Competibacteraceae bacterium]
MLEMSKPDPNAVAAAAEACAEPAGGNVLPSASRKERVAKTMLEMSLPIMESEAAPRERKKTRKIAKTLAVQDIRSLIEAEALSQSAQVEAGGATPVPAPVKKEKQPVAKTMLDHDVLFQAVSQSFVLKESRMQEVIRQKASQPLVIIEPIECKKKALPCKWRFPESDSGKVERFRYCDKCQTPVYNFDGLSLEQAEAVIFQRENIKKPSLYKRADGKFMTRDCPVEVKRRKDRHMMIAAAGLFVIILLTVLFNLPPAPKPAVTQEIEPEVKHKGGSKTKGASTGTGKTGSLVRTSEGFHYDADAPANSSQTNVASPVTPPAETTAPQAPPSPQGRKRRILAV